MPSSCTCSYSKYAKTIGDSLAQVYFRLCTLAFWLVNIFIEKKVVSPINDPILLKSVRELKELLQKRETTSTEIVEAYIKRVEEVNPLLNAIVYRNYDEARKEAQAVDSKIRELGDQELSSLLQSKPLLGLPFAVKDCILVKGAPCTVGVLSRKIAWERMEVDAVTVKLMKDSGAIFLISTTIPETCLWIETFTVAYGKTVNPYDSRRHVGGSSGGLGALLGAGAALMGIGSDLGGSIRIPSYQNGVFGMMCSPGKVEIEGHIPGVLPNTYKEYAGRLGPMTRFAEDLPLLVSVLSNKSVEEKKIALKEAKFYLVEGITHNKRIEPQQTEPLEAMRKALHYFELKAGTIAQSISLPETEDLLNMYAVSIFEEGDPNWSYFLRDIMRPTVPVNCYTELVKALFGQSEYSIYILILCIAPWFNNFTSAEHHRLREKREHFKERIIDILGDNGVIFYPSWPTLPQFHYETVFKQTTLVHTGIVNMLGLPAVQCPMGLTNGVPNGVQIIGGQGSEHLLMEIAQEVSKAFGGWVPPTTAC